jgi:hypothetical protein
MPITVADVKAAEQAVNKSSSAAAAAAVPGPSSSMPPPPLFPMPAAQPPPPPQMQPPPRKKHKSGGGDLPPQAQNLPVPPAYAAQDLALRRNLLGEIHRLEALYHLEPNHGINDKSSVYELESYLDRLEMEINGEGDVAMLRDFTKTAAWVIEGGSMLVPGVDLTNYQINVEKQIHTLDKAFRDLVRKYGGTSMGPEAAIAMRLGQIALETHRENTSQLRRLVARRRQQHELQQFQHMQPEQQPDQHEQEQPEPETETVPQNKRKREDVLEANNLTMGIPAPKRSHNN